MIKNPWGLRTKVSSLNLDFNDEAFNATEYRLSKLREIFYPFVTKDHNRKNKVQYFQELFKRLRNKGKIPRYLLYDAWGRKIRFLRRALNRNQRRILISFMMDPLLQRGCLIMDIY